MLSVIYRPLQLGGAEKAAVDLATHLDPERYESSLCALAKTGELLWRTAELEAAGVPLHRIERESARDLVGFRRYARFLREGNFDLVHAHLWDAHVWTAAALLGRRRPVLVAHEHTWSFEGERARRFLDRNLVARRAHAFIAVSRADREKMIERVGLPGEKIHQIANGIDAPPPVPGQNLRRELGIPADAAVLGAVAVLRPQKRLDVLLRAHGTLLKNRPSLHLVIVGTGSAAHRAKLAELVDRLGTSDHVHFLGARTDVGTALAGIDIACLSSDYEGMPLAVLEYMAAGKPVVATAVGGVIELIESEVSGLLVARRDPAALAAAIGRLLDHPALARQLAARARAIQEERFSLKAFVQNTEHLYDQLHRAADAPRPSALRQLMTSPGATR